jgi:hypothetical protein
MWAQKTVEKGDVTSKHLVGMTIDRFLINTGSMQLFGSQFKKPDYLKGCYCIEAVEPSFL